MKEREEGLGRGMKIEWPNKIDGKTTRKRWKEIKTRKGKSIKERKKIFVHHP